MGLKEIPTENGCILKVRELRIQDLTEYSKKVQYT